MKHISYTLVLTFIFSQSLVAQKNYTMQEAVLGLSQHLRIENWEGLKLNDNATYQRVVGYNSDKYLVNYSLNNLNVTDTVLSLSKFNKSLFAGADSVKSFPQFKWTSDKQFNFLLKNKYYKGNIDKKNNTLFFQEILSIPQDAENLKQDDAGKIFVYTLKNNLYCIDELGNNHTITNDVNPHIINGQSVHRNEFGIDGGIFISPNAQYVAYYKMDESMVADYPIVEWSGVPATTKNIKYPMAGDTSHQVSLWIYNIKTKTNQKVIVNNQLEDYLTGITWHPDNQSIYITHLDRAQKNAALKQYAIANGQNIKTITTESNDKFVEPQNPLYFLPDGKDFLYWSQQSGKMQLYKYNSNGQFIKKITQDDILVKDIIGINPKTKNILITAIPNDPRQQHIYAVNYDNGTMKQLTTEPGMHNGSVSKDGNYIIDEFRNESNPRTINLINTKNNKTNQLLKATSTLTSYNNAIVQNITMFTADSTPLYGKLMLPHDYNPNKKYPVIVYLYNGPHVQLINRSYPESGNLWYDLMTQKGFVVFSMDGRGSANRGVAFEQAIYGQLGTVEMEDQLIGVKYLKSLPFIDSNRMGVHGWSFGGFMTTSLMTRHPGVFKVGVAGGPVIDWSMYEIMYTERYMNTPQNNKKGYDESELTSKAKNLDGKLLMIHGADDDVVVWQHSIKFIKACVDAGKQVDYFVFPGHPHNVRGKDRVHLMQKITDYFIDNL